MEVKKENLLNALNTGSENVKEVVLALFPELKEETAQEAANRPITERVKTFEDALNILGEENQLVKEFRAMTAYGGQSGCSVLGNMLAFLELRIICSALNEGWQPLFDKHENRFYPYFYLFEDEEVEGKTDEWKRVQNFISTERYTVKGYIGLGSVNVLNPEDEEVIFTANLALKSRELAEYCGKQFIELWADFYLIRRDEE